VRTPPSVLDACIAAGYGHFGNGHVPSMTTNVGSGWPAARSHACGLAAPRALLLERFDPAGRAQRLTRLVSTDIMNDPEADYRTRTYAVTCRDAIAAVTGWRDEPR
jgi:hypothetical protein